MYIKLKTSSFNYACYFISHQILETTTLSRKSEVTDTNSRKQPALKWFPPVTSCQTPVKTSPHYNGFQSLGSWSTVNSTHTRA